MPAAGLGSAARAGMPGLGRGSGGMWVPRAAHTPCCCQPSPAKTAAGGWKEAEIEIRAPLGTGSWGGTKSAQPHPCSSTSSAGSPSLSASFCLGHLPAPSGCFCLTQLPIDCSKRHLALKLKGKKPKQQRPQHLCGMAGASSQPHAQQQLLLQH